MALLFKRTCLLNIIYRHLDLVKDLVFILAILLNVFVMMSYTIYDGNSMYQPKLFYHFNTYCKDLRVIRFSHVDVVHSAGGYSDYSLLDASSLHYV